MSPWFHGTRSFCSQIFFLTHLLLAVSAIYLRVPDIDPNPRLPIRWGGQAVNYEAGRISLEGHAAINHQDCRVAIAKLAGSQELSRWDGEPNVAVFRAIENSCTLTFGAIWSSADIQPSHLPYDFTYLRIVAKHMFGKMFPEQSPTNDQEPATHNGRATWIKSRNLKVQGSDVPVVRREKWFLILERSSTLAAERIYLTETGSSRLKPLRAGRMAGSAAR